MNGRERDAAPLDPDQERSLDPEDWPSFRRLAHQVLDGCLDHLETRTDRPVWRPVPEAVKAALRSPLPAEGEGAAAAARALAELVMPYDNGNPHPAFFGWVHGGGTAGGMLAELLAASINANLGGREHAPVYLERQVLEWCKALFGFPDAASGLLVSGTSMATLIGLAVARHRASGDRMREAGVAAVERRLTAYGSIETHGAASKAMELLGLGSRSLRRVAVRADFSMDLDALVAAIDRDTASGHQPFAVIATAGSVNTGAIDDLAAMADLCGERGIWLHVDGAFGALAVLSERLKPRLCGIERADSLAFDFHKWLHVPYDAGCILIRDEARHRAAFSSHQDYLQTEERGLAAGHPWFCEYGLELSRGFRALKVWFTLKEHGARRLGEQILQNCRQAAHLAAAVEDHPKLQLLAPVSLNIVCFRFIDPTIDAEALDRLNAEIVIRLHEHGIAAPSTTRLGGRLAIRVNITNHRTRRQDLDHLRSAVVMLGDAVTDDLQIANNCYTSQG